MGTIKIVKCHTCNQQWTHHHGFGFIVGYYYCNKCGKQKSVNFLDNYVERTVYISNEYGKCECGGTFRADSETILCPKCHTPVEDVKDSGILWD